MNNRESFKLNPSDCIYMLEAPSEKKAQVVTISPYALALWQSYFIENMTVCDFRGADDDELAEELAFLRYSLSRRLRMQELRKRKGPEPLLRKIRNMVRDWFAPPEPPPPWCRVLILRTSQRDRIKPILQEFPELLAVTIDEPGYWPKGLFEMKRPAKESQPKEKPLSL